VIVDTMQRQPSARVSQPWLFSYLSHVIVDTMQADEYGHGYHSERRKTLI